jgi:hypothetical protein
LGVVIKSKKKVGEKKEKEWEGEKDNAYVYFAPLLPRSEGVG